jgi:hypothetical protein
MGIAATVDIDQKKYCKLLAKTLPSSIETDEEFEWMAALLEELTIPERALNGKRGIGKKTRLKSWPNTLKSRLSCSSKRTVGPAACQPSDVSAQSV